MTPLQPPNRGGAAGLSTQETRHTPLLTPDQWRLVGIGAGIGVMIGSLLPWITVTTVFGQIDMAGTEGDGVATLGLGAATVVGFLARWWWVYVFAAFAAAGIAIYHVFNVNSAAAVIESNALSGSVGWGLWLTLVVALTAFAAALVLAFWVTGRGHSAR